MGQFIKRVSITLAMTVLAFVSACNTTKGLGKDVEKAGASMKESAERKGAD